VTGPNTAIKGQAQLPPGTTRIVTFDTNAYRRLGRNKAKALRQREREAGVLALASPIVIQELAAHLADQSDPDYKYCMGALAGLAEHTWSPSGQDIGLCLHPDTRSTMCRQLFGVIPPDAEQRVKDLSTLAVYVKDNAPTINDPRAVGNFRRCAAFVEEQEKQWVKMMRDVLAQNTAPSVDVWIQGVTTLTVINQALLIGHKLDVADIQQKAKILTNVFPVPFHLVATLMQRVTAMAKPALDDPKKKWGNYVWDFHICFYVGASHAIGDAKMYLVAGDKQIVKAAAAAGCGDRVISIEDHMKSVGLS
jgi:hypothetical protein